MFIGDEHPRSRSGMTNIEILDRAPDWERFRETFDRLSRVMPRFRQRVVVPSLPTTDPRWVVDPDFDLDYHVRRTHLPAPGTMRQLLDTTELITSAPLDVARPLWTTYLVEGLEGGRAAVVSTLSHVITDGVGGIAMAEQMYDLDREGTPRRMPPLPGPGELSRNELTLEGLRELPGRTLGQARGLLGTALSATLHPRRTLGSLLSVGSALGRSMAAANSPLLVRRGYARRVITIEVDLPAFKAACKQHGGSLNDGYVAALTLALQRYHEAKGVPVDTIPLAIPVNTRGEGDEMEGNSFAGVIFPAPVSEPDIGRRMRTIREALGGAREQGVVDLMGMVAPVVVKIPGPLLEAMDGHMVMHDVQASNVMSYPVTTYIAGAKVLAQYGVGPVPGVAMMAMMLTRDGGCYISTRYDRLAFDDDALWADCLTAGFVDLIGDRAAVSEADGELAPVTSARATTNAAKKATAKKAAAKKAPAKKAAAEKTTAKKTAARSAAKKSASTKPVATKPAAEPTPDGAGSS